ncbi:hypothetical protein E2C01_022382 [Portunus trituberculatus]|uniref:Uncharacterized protein n=1 Tax=Portunus trituberculatus TaxID=210409 RepID=A0A5B7E570_PORTR|nr:hypothetical protein [Portunus trituberculatus]
MVVSVHLRVSGEHHRRGSATSPAQLELNRHSSGHPSHSQNDSRVDEVMCMHVCEAGCHIQGHAKQCYLAQTPVTPQHSLEVPLQERHNE